MQIAAFVACGALAGFAGFLFVGRFGTINVTAGSGLELAAIAAAVVGGVSTLGGSGTVIGAFLGAVLIAVLDQSLVRVEQISEFWRDAILGALILLAVLLDVGVGRRLASGRVATAHARRAEAPVRWLLAAALHVGAAARRRSCSATIVFNLSESSGYLSVDNFVNLFQLHIEKVIVVVTMTFVIIAGEIDLSVASVMAWSASVLAALHEHDVPFALAIVAALAAAAVAGLIHGCCIARLGLPSLVVTLAGLIGWRGAARVLVEDRSIGDFPRWFDRLGQDDLIGPLPLAARHLLRAVRRRLGRAAPHGRPAASCTSSATTPRSPATPASTSCAPASCCSSRRRSSPGWPASCSPPGSAPSAATWPPASSWRSSRSCCSAASASSAGRAG